MGAVRFRRRRAISLTAWFCKQTHLAHETIREARYHECQRTRAIALRAKQVPEPTRGRPLQRVGATASGRRMRAGREAPPPPVLAPAASSASFSGSCLGSCSDVSFFLPASSLTVDHSSSPSRVSSLIGGGLVVAPSSAAVSRDGDRQSKDWMDWQTLAGRAGCHILSYSSLSSPHVTFNQ